MVESFVFEFSFAGRCNSTVARLKGMDGYGYRMHRVSSLLAGHCLPRPLAVRHDPRPSWIIPACPEISRLIRAGPKLSVLAG